MERRARADEASAMSARAASDDPGDRRGLLVAGMLAALVACALLFSPVAAYADRPTLGEWLFGSRGGAAQMTEGPDGAALDPSAQALDEGGAAPAVPAAPAATDADLEQGAGSAQGDVAQDGASAAVVVYAESTVDRALWRYAQDTCAGVIAEALAAGQAEVDDLAWRGFSVDEAKAALAALSYDPEFYYFDPASTTIWNSSLTGAVTKVELGYAVGADDLAGYRARLEDAAAEALAWASGAASDAEVCQALHDYLVRTVVYDEDARDFGSSTREVYSPYGALVGRSCVCDGYSEAYVLLLRRAGVEARMVVSEEMVHSWVMVRLGDVWYHVDPTWDDPTPDAGWAADVRRTYFLRGDEAMRTLGDEPHTGWATSGERVWQTYGDAAVSSGGIAADDTATPACPQDYSLAVAGIDQDAETPGDVSAAYPTVFDGAGTGPDAGVSAGVDGWLALADAAGNERTFWMEGGAAARGWRDIDDARYWFNPTSSVMARSCFRRIDGEVYRFDDDGHLAFGDRAVDWWLVWLDPQTGVLAHDAFVDTPDGRTLYCDHRGHLARGSYQTPDGVWRCFDVDTGDMRRGVFLRFDDQDAVYYYDADGARVYGEQWIDGRTFRFDPETGALDDEGRAHLVW